MKITLLGEIILFPTFGFVYTIGVIASAAGFGAYSAEVGTITMYLLIGLIILCVAAFLDCWRSTDMKFAPNRPLKRHIRLHWRQSRLYKLLWFQTAARMSEERGEVHRDDDIEQLMRELNELKWEVSARIEKKIFFHNDGRDMKEEERARLMAEVRGTATLLLFPRLAPAPCSLGF